MHLNQIPFVFAGLLLAACQPFFVAQEKPLKIEPVPETREITPVSPYIDSEMLAAGCSGCHGTQGISTSPAIPSLAGLPENYFIQVMQAYQYGGRYGTVMPHIALGYSNAEINRMAGYFSRLEARPMRQRVDFTLISRGRKLHQAFCRECHGDLEQPPKNGAVRLNGQWLDYLRWTLKDYLIGINQTDEEMSESFTRLLKQHGDEGIEALIVYYASARP